jgi:hypothetical protein
MGAPDVLYSAIAEWSERQDRIEAARSVAVRVRSMVAEDLDPDAD